MNRRLIAFLLMVGLILALCGLSAVALATTGDPLAIEMELTPTALTGPGSVRVNLNIMNVSDSPSTVTVTLYDPVGNVCTGFGSGGTANLSQGGAASYSGTWNVTQAQLDAGRIIYSARYSMTGADGQPYTTSRPISKSIRYETANANMTVSRTAPSKAVQGQTTKVTYLLTNTGTVDAINIKLTDAGLSSEPLNYARLEVGKSYELSYNFVMGEKPLTSKPTITYEYMVGNTTHSKKIEGTEKLIDVAKVDVLVELTASTLIVNPGDKVELSYTIKNQGDLAYQKLKITDPSLGDIDSGISLAAGKSHTNKKSVTVNQTATYRLTVSGEDGSGTPVSFTSNEVTVQTANSATASQAPTGPVVPLDLILLVEGDRDIVYELPSEIIFRIKVINAGTTDVENVVLSAHGKNVKTIDKIAVGEEYVLTKEFQASMGGQYQFKATAKDSAAKNQEFVSNIFPVAYQPLPTATPTPTAPQPTEPPVVVEVEPTNNGPNWNPSGTANEETSGTGNVLLYALVAVIGLIAVAVVTLFVLDRRKIKPAPLQTRAVGTEAVIDSMQRTPHRDYARAPKRGAVSKRTSSHDVYVPKTEEIVDHEEPIRALDANYDLQATQRVDPSQYQRQRPVMNEEATITPKLSEEDAALLSGSTGQYRLSRRALARPEVTPVPENAPLDPEAFAREQRAQRAPKVDLSSFYDDDDDQGVSSAPKGRKRKE